MISKIQYKNKQSIQNDENIAEENKVTDTNMNEIKQVVNNNAEEMEEVQTNISNIEKKNTEQDKNITNNTKSIEELKTENEALKVENKLIKEQIPSATASGNSVHIEDSGTLDFEWKIRGGHKQETREGYNKINLSSISTEVTGIKASYDNETGYITFNGTPNANYPRFFSLDITDMLNDGEKWTIWQEKAPPGTDKEILLQVIERKSATENTHYYSSASSGNKTSFTVDKTQYSYYLNLLGGTIANIGTLTNYKNRYMLYKGTDDKEYEQYGVSPSSYYPSEIETVGSNINYFDENTVESKFLNSKTGQTSDNASWRCTDFIEILSKQYNFSWESESAYFQVTVCYYDKNKTFISGNEYGLYGIYSKTFEIPDGANYMKVAYSIVVTGKPATRDKIKLEIGNKRTLYSPFMCASVEIDVVNKNFLNISNKLDGTSIGVTTTTNNNGSIHISGTTMRAGPLFEKGRVKVGYLKAGTYSFSAKLIGSSQTTGANSCLYFRPASNGKEYVTMIPYANGTVFNNRVTLASDTEVFIEWYCNKSGVSIDADLYVQIERATANTETEQHQSQTAIMPIQQEMLTGDYISDKEYHNWNKYVFTGEENLGKSSIEVNNTYWINQNSIPDLLNAELLNDNTRGTIVPNFLSTHFKTLAPEYVVHHNNIGITLCANDGNLKDVTIRFGFGLDSDINTADKCKAWLKAQYDAGTPVIVYYKLATPIDLELTAEQKSIRDTKLYTYKNITNIILSDELASIDVKYGRDLDAIINNLQAMSINNASEEV